MAILQAPTSTAWGLFDSPETMPVAGTFAAKCVEVRDEFGVERKKFQSEEMEEVDLTAFNFAYQKGGEEYTIATRPMRISGNEKANLFKFLKSWLGHAPKMGWDYCEMQGKSCLITVAHEQKKTGDGVYATIVSVTPMPEGYNPAEPTAHVDDSKLPF